MLLASDCLLYRQCTCLRHHKVGGGWHGGGSSGVVVVCVDVSWSDRTRGRMGTAAITLLQIIRRTRFPGAVYDLRGTDWVVAKIREKETACALSLSLQSLPLFFPLACGG